MVVAPHADDEVMGCGGLIAKYPHTEVMFVASMDSVRHREMMEAWSRLGGTGEIEKGGFPDGDVGQREKALVSWLDAKFAYYRPDEVYLPYPGSHQDHVAVFEAGMRACRQSLNPQHWMPPTVLVYDTPTYDLNLVERGLRFGLFEALGEEHVLAKAKAMEAYESQTLKPHAGSPDELVARARSIGLARGLEYAEQFAVVRMVR